MRVVVPAIVAALGLAAPVFAQPTTPFGATKEVKPTRTEFGILPAFAFNSDIGVGVGFVANIARFEPAVHPYRVRVSGRFFVFLREPDGAPPEAIIHSHLLRFELPGLADGRLRVDIDIPISRNAIAGYSGLGHGSVFEKPWEGLDEGVDADSLIDARNRNRYDRWFPGVRVAMRGSLRESLEAYGTYSVTYNAITVYPGSRLEEDLGGASGPEVAGSLFGLAPHARIEASMGVLWDTRDHEQDPVRGIRVDAGVRVGMSAGSAGVVEPAGGAVIDARGYAPLVPRHLVLAGRAALDVQFGDVPVYDLTRMGGLRPLAAFGGGRSIRGAPPERWHGKVKGLAGVELRGTFPVIAIRRQRFRVGCVAFLDVGRVWAEARRRPDLDDGPPLHVGVGGGVRLRWGETFVLRVDGGWSPGGGAAYFDVGHVF